MLPLLGEPIIFIGNTSTQVLSEFCDFSLWMASLTSQYPTKALVAQPVMYPHQLLSPLSSPILPSHHYISFDRSLYNFPLSPPSVRFLFFPRPGSCVSDRVWLHSWWRQNDKVDGINPATGPKEFLCVGFGRNNPTRHSPHPIHPRA